MKKSHGAKSGEYGGYSSIGICNLAKKCFSKSAIWETDCHGAKSTCMAKDWYSFMYAVSQVKRLKT
jgi:hypothetical protein